MDIIRCIVVDDEPLPLELMEDYIRKTPFLKLVGTYSSPIEALSVVTKDHVDLAFLDIQMTEINGLQLSQLLKNRCKVIFTTAYPQYALNGFELDAVDYLLKPVSFERFLQSIGKAKELIAPETRIEIPVKKVDFSPQTIFVKTGQKIVQVAIDDILYIEGLREYIAIHTQHGKIITLQTFKKTEESLPPGRFIRVHKSYLVAFDKISSIEKGQLFIQRKGIPIGEVYREAFFLAIRQRNFL
ncbi:LytTR family DNA-binding domain-containing protein [Paraflavitalea sp. CAU 1676]|uniref:LytR/AlgR family response regulator transcription factor n=1 Tax=Paraflavitalea sp. CAU 1676 TaxID=3032598 RepID=UPI0023DA3590|nr:LytTR family DNA-binding domain-containing protein [Paraflavitalea sp. CAU 1676]MDF2193188.1 LytTR family DNA-binding domain-containing protein [Paraflavitalea sp. CAU 1676]